MAFKIDPIERSVTAAATYTDLKRWPRLLSPMQPIPTARLVLSVLVSMVIHVVLVFLVCVWPGNRRAVEPTAASIDAPMNVSFVSLPRIDVVSGDETDREAVSVAPRKDPPVQSESKAEAELVAVPEDREVPVSVVSEEETLTAETTPSIDPEPERISARLIETVVTSREQGKPGSGVSEGKSPATGATPSINLEAAYQIAREVGKTAMPDSAAQELRFQSRKLYLENHLGIIRKQLPDCRTKYTKGRLRGFLAIPSLLKDTVTDSGCDWRLQEDRERERDPRRETDLERQNSRERLDAFSDLITDTIIDP